MTRSTSAGPSAPSNSEPYCPDAGDIIWIDLDPVRGQEQRGRRPVLVLTPHSYNRLAKLCVVCAMTTHVKGYPFEVAMPDGAVVLADQIRTVAWPSRDTTFKARAPEDALREVRGKLKALLGMN